MKIYTLYSYDKEIIEAWINHYCHIPCIDEIIIQNQNYSKENSEHLYKIVAEYIDLYDVKIVVIPTKYEFPKEKSKRSQFLKYGQPDIRNRVIQNFINCTWITGAPDEVIYGKNYDDTNQQLLIFEKEALRHATLGWDTPGFIPLYSVTNEGFRMGEGGGMTVMRWKWRITYNINPIRHIGRPIHDFSTNVYLNNSWVGFTNSGGYYGNRGFLGRDVKLDGLKLLHYNPLIRFNNETAEYKKFIEGYIANLDEHPHHYMEKLPRL